MVLADYPDDEEQDRPEDHAEERPRDPVVDDARVAIEEFLNEKRGDTFYLKQLQVIFERRFYHWITAKAVSELVAAGKWRDAFVPLHEGPGTQPTTVRFIFHPKNRYTARVIRRKVSLIRRFSTQDVGRACGRQAEILFSRAILAKGFRLAGEDTRTYQNRSWSESAHDLDFVFERDGVAYGCEIKNRFEYIDRNEMRTKLAMCRHLGLTPLFIMRAAPKSYINEIWKATGFTKVFQTHIFPFGAERLVEDIRKEFDGLPVDSPRDLPNTILDRLLEAHLARLRRSQP